MLKPRTGCSLSRRLHNLAAGQGATQHITDRISDTDMAFALAGPLAPSAPRAPEMRMVMSAAEAVPRKALWKPGEIAPDYLDGRLAGDAGFDPLCLVALASKPATDLLSAFPTKAQRSIIMSNLTPEQRRACVDKMRDAEIKHARLAMVSANRT